MVKARENPFEPVELARNIRERLARRAGGQVRAPDVTINGNRIAVSGCVRSYYLKQLLLEAVLDVVRPLDASGVDFDVQVRPSERTR
jgi:hypothetical protein